MSKKVQVAAIQIQYPDGEVKQLSIDDARELFKELEGLFGSKTTYLPSTPVVIERDRYPWSTFLYDQSLQPVVDEPPPKTPKVWCCT